MYVRDRAAFLRAILALSDEAAKLLARILDPNPATRLTLAQMRVEVLGIRTFFPADGHPGCMRAARELLSHRDEFIADEEAPWADADDDESVSGIAEVPREAVDAELARFDLGVRRPPSSLAGFVDVPLNSSAASSQASTFVNQRESVSSIDTEETLPPTPISPASEIPGVVPHLALAAGGFHQHEVDVMTPLAEDGHHEGRVSKNMRRFVGAVRRVVWA